VTFQLGCDQVFCIDANQTTLWDRRTEGYGLPVAEVIKSRINSYYSNYTNTSISKNTTISRSTKNFNNIVIIYCYSCRWLLRATWIAQELLTTFSKELFSVTLQRSLPCDEGGLFKLECNGKLVWDRKEEGKFPQAKEVKRRVRDEICPGKMLGHNELDKEENFEDKQVMDIK
jgi:selenoprotein W-related protein